MTKTPYELRFELLAMAQAIITENLMNERIRLENDWNLNCEKNRINAERLGDVLQFPEFPVIPQIDINSVIETAKILNEFVSNNNGE